MMKKTNDDFLTCVQTGILASMSSPDYGTVSPTRRAYDAVALMGRALRVRESIPEKMSTAEAVTHFLKWEFAPQFRDKAPSWISEVLDEG